MVVIGCFETLVTYQYTAQNIPERGKIHVFKFVKLEGLLQFAQQPGMTLS